MVTPVPAVLRRESHIHNSMRYYGLHKNVTHVVEGEYRDKSIIRISNDVEIPIKLNREQRRKLK